jgi:hypothetical protein
MRVLIIIFTVYYFTACIQNGEKVSNITEKSINQPTRSLSTLKQLVLTKGDEDAYYELSMAYLDFEYPEEFLMYAMFMANRYNHAQAYFDVYNCLENIYYSDITKIDEETARLAIDYLIKASEKEHEQAQEMVKEYSVTKDIIDKKSLIIAINK